MRVEAPRCETAVVGRRAMATAQQGALRELAAARRRALERARRASGSTSRAAGGCRLWTRPDQGGAAPAGVTARLGLHTPAAHIRARLHTQSHTSAKARPAPRRGPPVFPVVAGDSRVGDTGLEPVTSRM